MPGYKIKRIFPHVTPLKVGQIVEDPNWRNLGLLVKQGYVEEITESKKVAKVKQQPKIVEAPLQEQNVQEAKTTKNKPAPKTK